jgi:hypothetical protein
MKPRSAGHLHVGARRAMVYPQTLPIVSVLAPAQGLACLSVACRVSRSKRSPLVAAPTQRGRRAPVVRRPPLPSLAALPLTFAAFGTLPCRARSVPGHARRVASADFQHPKVGPVLPVSVSLRGMPSWCGVGASRGRWPHRLAGSVSRPNPPVNLAPFGRWTLRDEAAQRRLPARWG